MTQLINVRLTDALTMFTRLILALSMILLATSAAAETGDGLTSIKFINDWKWEGQAAPLLLCLDKGYFKNELLSVTLDKGTGSVNAIPRVASGEYQMGSADINSLIKWRSENPDSAMKAVYIIYNVAPFAVIGRPSLGVIGPTDLEGRILGAPAFDGAFAHWPEFVAFNGIIEDKVVIKDVDFPVREPMLAAGEVDAITGFSFTSYVSLQQNGVPKEDISLMLMSDFGLDLYGNAIIVNPEFAQQHPDAVKAFLRAAVLGYQETIANPTAALEHVVSRVENADPDMELSRLIMAIGHHIATEEVRSFGLGSVVETRLNKSIEQLSNIHGFTHIPTASDVFDSSFLPSLDARQIPPAPEPSDVKAEK